MLNLGNIMLDLDKATPKPFIRHPTFYLNIGRAERKCFAMMTINTNGSDLIFAM